jgi:hypothetical protein
MIFFIFLYKIYTDQMLVDTRLHTRTVVELNVLLLMKKIVVMNSSKKQYPVNYTHKINTSDNNNNHINDL